MFTAWYSAEVQKQMESAGTSTDEIKVDLRLSVLNPLQATWLVSLYDPLTGSMGKRHIAKGWSVAEISELVQGKTTLSPEGPLENIEAIIIWKLIGSAIELNSASVAYISLLRFYFIMIKSNAKWKFKKRAPLYLIREI